MNKVNRIGRVWKMKYLNMIIFLFVITHLAKGQKIITNGSIQLGKDTINVPAAGTIRWTGADFEGWTGSRWLSLTLGDKVMDVDGNVYYPIKIGNQIWLDRNLKTSKYNDGTIIPLSSNAGEWNTAAVNLLPSYCWYNDDQLTNGISYGALYNFYALDSTSNGGKNVCPTGWIVPSKTDIERLRENLGGQNIAGGKLKEVGFSFWLSPNYGANNISGFSAVGAGRRGPSGTFAGLKTNDYIRTRTLENYPNSTYGLLSASDEMFVVSEWNNGIGMSIRCIRE
jgi:uncharacterized protein (TIGR02145 family)